jgi:molecular chaperone HtpG
MPKAQEFNFDVEVGKVLNLMINSLYTNKDVALRELVSNAADACDKIRYLAAQDSKILTKDDELKISITTDKAKRLLIISDNGVGMNRDELIQNLGTIARSGTENFIKSLTGDNKKDVQLIGQFGVGFYSSFMIADKVTVVSRKFDEDKSYQWESDGSSNFKISEGEKDFTRGTKITLHLKKDADDFLDRFHIKHVVQTYSDHINIKIDFIPENLESGAKVETLNSSSALWTRPQSDITKEQYQEFFKHISHLPGEPFMTIHNKVEGVVTYTNLLFIPSTKPFDLFHPDRKTSIKLYAKKVFISEDLSLVPAYLRFLRGLIDSDDLPLNISRETLQHNLVIEKIKKSVVKKVISELKKKANKDPEGYINFWNNFGAVLKEGLCDSSDNRENLLEICRFYSSKSPDKLISLGEYLERCKANQDKIFFLSGESVEKIQSSPQLEIFSQKDVEVLFLTDAVDDFWVTVALPYKEKEFQSITRSDIDLENIDKSPEEKKSEDEKSEEDKKDDIKDVTSSQFEALVKFMKETLGAKVKDVKVSKKLTDSPVCLAVDAQAMDIRMERFLLEQKQIVTGSAKILEINPNNKIIKSLNNDLADESKKQAAQDSIRTLFDLACMLEDEPVNDTKDFSRRLQSLMA